MKFNALNLLNILLNMYILLLKEHELKKFDKFMKDEVNFFLEVKFSVSKLKLLLQIVRTFRLDLNKSKVNCE